MRRKQQIRLGLGVIATFILLLNIIRINISDHPGAKVYYNDTYKTCKPIHKIGFLKIHKCASSSVQNIILRYALKNQLNVVLPTRGNYLGNIKNPFSREMLRGTPWEEAELEYDIFCLHTVWNQSEVEKTLGEGASYVTMIRDPVDIFESAWGYAQLSNFYKMDLETFALSPKTGLLAEENPTKTFGQNQILRDFGLHPDNFTNGLAVEEKIKQIEDKFNLVLLAERFQESMILMKNELCWDYRDVINMKLNARQELKKTSLSPKAREALEKYLSQDYLVYNHFKKIFEKKVEMFGKEKMEKELNILDHANKNIREVCSLQETKNENISGENKLWGKGLVAYQVDIDKNPVCRFMALSELNFLQVMREEQSLRAEPILNRRNRTEQVLRKDFGIQANQAALSKLKPRDLERIKAILSPA
ncbi:galactosylceramide sulfotransferase [Eurytemora carolleeae]|uniref:galactosylceramide sulfotransferase n=1 Tax=Eurytemora carolleeae TaxID=1294199 RepID=UPI000C794AA9|nr:galactosylceramide sulfotransferase [Eurytemora carolleeae]|eukprot:XP_023321017.1 galactosylceramide sulfotransferase-like [Eurytemora affinis]